MKLTILSLFIVLFSLLSYSQNTNKPVISNIQYTCVDIPQSCTLTWDTDSCSDSLVGIGGFNWFTNLKNAAVQDNTFGTCKTNGHSWTHNLPVPVTTSGAVLNYEIRSRGFTGGSPDNAKATYVVSTLTTSPRKVLAGAYDYAIDFLGTYHINRQQSDGAGGDAYLQLRNWATEVPTSSYSENNTIAVTGIPPATTVTKLYNLNGATWTQAGTTGTLVLTQNAQVGNTLLQLQTSSSTPVGGASCESNGGVTVATTDCKYTIHFNAASAFSPTVNHNYTWDLIVRPAATFPFATPASYPAIPCIKATDPCTNSLGSSAVSTARFETWAVTYGQRWAGNSSGLGCADDFSAGTGTSVMFYDGTDNMINLYKYDLLHSLTGDPGQWLIGAKNCKYRYRDAYLFIDHTHNPDIPCSLITGYFSHSRGSYDDYILTGDTKSKQVPNCLANHEINHVLDASALDPIRIRETAFSTEAHIYNDRLGGADSVNAALGIGLLKSIIDGVVTADGNGRSWVYEQFQVAEACKILLDYYDNGHSNDLSILAAVKSATDFMWQTMWVPPIAATNNTGMLAYRNADFLYLGNDPGNSGNVGSEFRAIIPQYAFLYARMFRDTGNARMTTTYLDGAGDTYQEAADELIENYFLIAPSNGPNFTGKNWSQMMRDMFQFIKYRSAPGTLDNPLIPPRLAGGKGSPMIGKGSTQ